MNESARAMLKAFREHDSRAAAGAVVTGAAGVGADDTAIDATIDAATAWSFGMNSALADELAELVVAGTKRATATSREALQKAGEMPPQVGQYSVILDGQDTARCIILTEAVREGQLSSVTDAFAWREGEGDRSRAYWLAAHQRYFAAEHAELGLAMHDDIPVLFEEFRVVWPPEFADA